MLRQDGGVGGVDRLVDAGDLDVRRTCAGHLFLGERVDGQGLDALGGEGHRRLGRHFVGARRREGGDRGRGGGAGRQAPGAICDDLGADAAAPGL